MKRFGLTGLRKSAVVRWATMTAAVCTTLTQLVGAAQAFPVHVVHLANALPPGWSHAVSAEKLAQNYTQLMAARAKHKADVRPLSGKEMLRLCGRGKQSQDLTTLRQPAFNGTLPWWRSFHDVNLSTGNLFKSFTDIQVAPAIGAGLALQRTYNSDDPRIGPFGQGWTHAYDIHMADESTNSPTDASVNFSDRTDFFGHPHRYHRDADGLYTPPPYLFDELSSEYDTFLVGGPNTVTSDTQTGSDGTIKHFINLNDANYPDQSRVCDSITDRHGNATSLAYAPVTNGGATRTLLSTVTDPSGRQLQFTWTNISDSATAPVWRITEVDAVDTNNNKAILSVTYSYYVPGNGSPVTSANEFDLWKVTIDPNNLDRITTFDYMSVSYTNQPDGTTVTENGLLKSITSPTNLSDNTSQTVSYNYVLPISVGLTTVWVEQINEPGGLAGNLQWTINPLGFQGEWHNIINGMPVVCSSSDNNIVFAEHVDNNLRHEGFDTASAVTDFVTYSVGQTNTVSQEQLGNPVVFDGNYVETHNYTYDSQDNVLTDTVGTGSNDQYTTTYTYYDLSGYFQKSSVTDANGNITTFTVGLDSDVPGNRGEVLTVQDAGYNDPNSPSYHKQYSYTYYPTGQKENETNLNGVVTGYTYGDTWGNLTQVVQDVGDMTHLNRTTTMTYDAAGRVLSTVDPNHYNTGLESTFTYNNVGQPTEADFPESYQNVTGEKVKYDYDTDGRLLSVEDGRGTTKMYYEPSSDRVSSVADPVTGSVSYTYNLTGERASMGLPGGGTWTYQYAPASDNLLVILPKDDPGSVARRLLGITDDKGNQVGYIVDPIGRMLCALTNQTFNGGQSLVSWYETDYQYDGYAGSNGQADTHGWLTKVVNTYFTNGGQTSAPLVENDYSYTSSSGFVDKVGNRQQKTVNPGSNQRIEQYSYDELNRLTYVNYGDNENQTYTFDAMGNRLTLSDVVSNNNNNTTTVTSYSFDAANRLTSRQVGSNAAITYSFDPNGNTTGDATGNNPTSGARSNTWDSQNRLVKCVYNGSSGTETSSFDYAADGLRHQSSVTQGSTTTVTNYALDGSMFVRELNMSGVAQATYLAGPRGPEYRRDDTSNSSSAIHWYLYDGLGSVIAEMDSVGDFLASRKYDVYGAVRSDTNPTNAPESSQKFVGSLGHPTEAETGGMIYMRARWMDPVTGRFVSEDKKQNGVNWFLYCGNDPINCVDPSGNDTGQAGDYFVHGLASFLSLIGFQIGVGLTLAAMGALFEKAATSALALVTLALISFTISFIGSGVIVNLNLGLQTAAGVLGCLVGGPGLKELWAWFKGAGEVADQMPTARFAVMALTVYGMMCWGALNAALNTD